MQAMDIRISSLRLSQAWSICGYLGSFDPLHRGHEWIVEQLLERFDAVLVLIPAFHFEKTVRFPLNATLEQRIEMLVSLRKRWGDRIGIGLAHEVLFIRLAECLKEHLPSAEIFFGMGNETFERVLNSKVYYEQVGLPWTEEDHAKLERVREKVVVFGRSGNADHILPVPESVRWISSTLVRETVRECRKSSFSEATWHKKLAEMISPEIFTFIRQGGLYIE